MKTLFLLSNFMLVVANYNYAQNNDFRGLSWGCNIANVKTAEKKSNFLTLIKDDELIYTDILAGSDCEVFYIFNDNGKMVSGIYAFTKKYSNPQLYFQDYEKFKKLLVEKYGPPINDVLESKNNSQPLDKNNYGEEIAGGNLNSYCIWNTERSIIKIVLSSKTKNPSLEIHYTTRTLDELEDKEELEKALNKL